MTGPEINHFTFTKNISKHVMEGSILVFKRGTGFQVFSRDEISDHAAIDAINTWLIRDQARREKLAKEGSE